MVSLSLIKDKQLVQDAAVGLTSNDKILKYKQSFIYIYIYIYIHIYIYMCVH